MARTHSNKTTHTSSQPMQDSSARNSTTSNRNGPTHQQIAKRAYELFLARGGKHGNHQDDWLQAERELKLGR